MTATDEVLALHQRLDGVTSGLTTDKLRKLLDTASAMRVDGGAEKASRGDCSKPPLALIPSSFIEATGLALGYGAAKYAPDNWRRGMAWSDVYSAMLRHLVAWWGGEDADAESGLCHLDHAAACLAFLVEYASHEEYERFDDRWVPSPQQGNPPHEGEGGK